MRGRGTDSPSHSDSCAQIDGKQYDATFRAEGLVDIVKLGLAYCKNKVELCADA